MVIDDVCFTENIMPIFFIFSFFLLLKNFFLHDAVFGTESDLNFIFIMYVHGTLLNHSKDLYFLEF